ncbi:MAG: hypothetical protein RLZZ120_23 [Actinomycetota bacterium]|jgi:predicted molibdopterin-dependent oxidoreductase YjgC
MNTFQFQNKSIPFNEGDSVGAALLRAGIKSLRKSRINGEPRAMMCGIGQCFDCVVTIDGKPLQRACITPARDGSQVCIDESSAS